MEKPMIRTEPNHLLGGKYCLLANVSNPNCLIVSVLPQVQDTPGRGGEVQDGSLAGQQALGGDTQPSLLQGDGSVHNSPS